MVLADSWLRPYRRTTSPDVRLVCFPHAGGAASFFQSWARRLPATVDVVGIRYPGREDRLHEPVPETIDALSDQIAEAMASLAGPPLAFFGHSMGASVGHEVAVRLERELDLSLAVLFVSARPAPPRLRPDGLHQQGDRALLEHVFRLNRRARAALAYPELLELMLPAIRADYQIVASYPRHAPTKIRAPIVGYGASADPEAGVEDIRSWRHVTAGRFDMRIFKGDHFYLAAEEDAVVADIARRLVAECSAFGSRGGSPPRA